MLWVQSGYQSMISYTLPPLEDETPWPTYDYGTIQIKKTDTSGNPLAGAKFTAVNTVDNSKKYEIGPTDEDGSAFSTFIPFGTYTVTETTFPDGYTSSGETSWTVTLDETLVGGVAPLITVVNKKADGKIGAIKQDEYGSPLSGVSFGIFSDSACSNLIATITTGSDGKAVSENLTVDTTYYLKETAAKNENYILDTTVYPVSVVTDTTTYINNGNAVTNTLKKGNLSVTKTVEYGSVAGITFRLSGTSASGTSVNVTATTNSSGVATFENILIGTYTLEEVNTASYYIPPAPQSITIKYGETAAATVENNLKKGSLNLPCVPHPAKAHAVVEEHREQYGTRC